MASPKAKSPKEMVAFQPKFDHLLDQESELFKNQQETMIVAFDTILQTLKNNQTRIIALEETLVNAYDEIDQLQDTIYSLETKLKTSEEEWKDIAIEQEVEIKKAKIQLEYMIPKEFELMQEKVHTLETKISLLQEIIKCKDHLLETTLYK